ncbi:MAG: dTDP-4-dehydrorhamnose 3,5-epimerase family protein [Nitrososphaerota archaeon]
MEFKFEVREMDRIKGVYTIKPTYFKDNRGIIWSTYLQSIISKLVPPEINFIHDKFSYSHKHVLRGIHGDNFTWKLISCVYGKIYEVIVDLRPGSPTYMKHEKFILKGLDPFLILIPPGIGNAYYVLSTRAVYHYKLAYVGNYRDFNEQFTIRWNDPILAIDWPCSNPILSERDMNGTLL